MGQDFNIFDASIYNVFAGGEGEIEVPSGGGAAVQSLMPGEKVYTTTLPGGKTVTVDDHGNILNVN